MRALGYAYLGAIFAFIFLPVVVLVLFSFQAGRLPVPPFDGPIAQMVRGGAGRSRLDGRTAQFAVLWR